MTFYIGGPVENDPSILKQRMENYLASYMPGGWQLQPGSLEDIFLSGVAMVGAEQGDVNGAMLDSAFRYFGKLVNVPAIDGAPATGTATITVQDNAGYTVPAATIIGLIDSAGTLQGFATTVDLIIPGGSTSGTVPVVAETPAAITNGLSGVAQLVQTPSFVTAATMTTTAGGLDAELDSVYLDRLAETLTTLTPRPVLPADFSVLARSVPGVFRATTVDLLKPGPPYDGTAEAAGQEKTVTVAVTDINGTSVGSTIRANVAAYLQSLREQNFKVFVVDPQYALVDVTATVYAWPGWDTTDVHARVVAALNTALNPGVWAGNPNGTAGGWANDPIIRQPQLNQIIMTVQGVRYVEPLTFRIAGGTLGTADITLGAGSAIPALPQPATLSITVLPTT